MSTVRVDLDEQTALFDEHTGNTYVFDVVTAEILLMLNEAVMTQDEIRQHLVETFQVESDSVLASHVEMALSNLEHSFLIHRVTTC
jgi:PqqD family protein of HPr-rel-A system